MPLMRPTRPAGALEAVLGTLEDRNAAHDSDRFGISRADQAYPLGTLEDRNAAHDSDRSSISRADQAYPRVSCHGRSRT
jgi:hypothetical protein